jgi:hypothetical protein
MRQILKRTPYKLRRFNFGGMNSLHFAQSKRSPPELD